MKMFSNKLIVIVFILLPVLLFSQVGLQDIKNIRVDQLSNAQVKEFIEGYTASGYTLDEVEKMALAEGMAPGEWAKLKARISNTEAREDSKEDFSKQETFSRTMHTETATSSTGGAAQRDPNRIPVFGSSLFNTQGLTFEPNLRLPTPEDYQLGVDDELIIDIFGFSENTMKVRISPEGFIRVPNVGQIQLNGLTIQQAKKIIINRLSGIYTTIHSGETSVAISLGNIRSIKVVMIGEVYRPGTYTLPSVSTVFNALNASGGPNRNGSFRKIKLIRNNKCITEVDIYDFLLKGELKNNLRLQDQDIIKIEPYQKRVELSGELKNTGFFEASEGEHLADLFNYAGGFTNVAYRDRIKVYRITDKEKSVADIAYNKIDSFLVQNGDSYIVGALLDRFTNRVQISGAIFRSGDFALEEGMTVKTLIQKADGLREDAFLSRAILTREKENKEIEVLSFNLEDIFSGKENDIVLRKEDKLFIASILDIKEKYYIRISGEVKNEGEYPYYENLTLKDVIFLAGGFKEKACVTNVEVSRLIKDPEILRTGKELTKGFDFILDEELNFVNGQAEFLLEPGDQVLVRPIPGYQDAMKVILEGEFVTPGPYILRSRNERISDLLKRAGGLNTWAYPEGAFLIRKQKESLAEEKLKSDVFKGVSTDDKMEVSGSKFMKNDGIVGIDLDKILKRSGTKWDLILEDGDIVSVPRELQTVQVSGQVLLPSHVRYDNSMSFKDYIEQSGGFNLDALKKKAFVVYPNGTAASTKRVFFVRSFPKVKPGSKIYVPKRPERKSLTTGEIISIGTTTVTLATLVITLVTLLNKK